MATTPSVGTPPHRTDKPWTEAVKGGAMTPLTAARPPPQPNHPFETHNPFTTLLSTHNNSMDDGSGQSDNILLTPADGDVTTTVGVLGENVANLDGACDVATVGPITIGAIRAQTNGVDPSDTTTTAAFDGGFQDNATGGRQQHTLPAPTAHLPPAPGHSPATLTDADGNHTLADNDDDILFRAIRVSLPEDAAVLVRQDKKIRALPDQVMLAITSAFTPLTETINTMNTRQDKMITALEGFKSQLTDLRMDINDHERRLTRLSAEVKEAQATASLTNPAKLETLVQSAITPVQASLDKELALAIKNAEAAVKSSFDTWVHASTNNVTASIKTFEKRIDALHGSSYGHLKKTTLLEFD